MACARVLGWLVWVFWFAGLVVFVLRCGYFLQACWLLRLAAVLSVGLALLGWLVLIGSGWYGCVCGDFLQVPFIGVWCGVVACNR